VFRVFAWLDRVSDLLLGGFLLGRRSVEQGQPDRASDEQSNQEHDQRGNVSAYQRGQPGGREVRHRDPQPAEKGRCRIGRAEHAEQDDFGQDARDGGTEEDRTDEPGSHDATLAWSTSV
jgi:hypothetical protein